MSTEKKPYFGAAEGSRSAVFCDTCNRFRPPRRVRQENPVLGAAA
jgi:hypothetical protein